MVAFYKHDIAAWMHGTAGLSDAAYRAYHVICQFIYGHEGPIPPNERYLAGACRQSVRTFRRAYCELIDAGKLIEEDGLIHNKRAENELSSIGNQRSIAKKGGENSGKARNSHTAVNKTNDLHEAAREQTRLEKTREESKNGSFASDADASPTPSPSPIYTDSTHELWGEGVPILASLGVPDGKVRPIIGRWLKQSGDAQAVLSAIQRARDHRVIEPIAWITRALTRGNGHAENRSLSAVARAAAERAQAFAAEDGICDQNGGTVVRLLPKCEGT